jgi:stage III sporulation protein AA
MTSGIDAMTETHTDDLHYLLGVLPPSLKDAIEGLAQEDLLEIVMDLGRLPQARYPGRVVDLAQTPVTTEDIVRVSAAVGEFGADNRAGIESTLHRISAIRNRKGQIVGLTLRVGRAVFGTIDQIRDQIEGGKSVLLLGPPGVGKTTRLREIARVLADEFGKRVIVIDTSNEIGGDGDVPHPAIGSARRMQVAHPNQQHSVMIEAVENHMPEVIVVDEIGTSQETLAARTIAERGVQLIATAHGTTLENLVQNPTLSDLIGGVQTVTLTDEEARLRGTQKTVSERKQPPTFDAVVEILDREQLVVHPEAAVAVDNLLRGRPPGGIRRSLGQPDAPQPAEPPPARGARPRETPWSMNGRPGGRQVGIYVYALSRDSVERAVRDLRLDARTVVRPERADMVIAQRARADDPRLSRILELTGMPLHTVKKNTTAQIRRLLQDIFNKLPGVEDADVQSAVREAEEAAQRVREEGVPAELTPQPPAVRKLQHKVAVRHQLSAHSQGSEPERHLVIYPD